MQYSVRKGVVGHYNVSYACPHCSTELDSPLEEAGANVKCPTCQRSFVTPGEKELAKVREAEEQERVRQDHERKRRMEEDKLKEIERSANAKLAENARRQREEERQRQQWEKEAKDTWADRFLAFAFKFAKFISVLVIAGCFAVIVFCLIMLLGSHAEKPTNTAGAFQPPTTGDYKQFLNASTSTNSSDASGANGANSLADQSSNAPSGLEARYDALLARFGLNSFDQQMEFIHLDRDAQETLVKSLTDFTQAISKSGPQAQATAVSWFIQTFKARWDTWQAEVQRQEQERRIAEEAASAKRYSLTLTIGASFGAVLSFLFLPLLIQIEKNTRRFYEHVRHASTT